MFRRHFAHSDDFGVSREALFAALDRLEHALEFEPHLAQQRINELERLWELAGFELVKVRRVNTPRPCPSCSGSGRWADDIPCGRCEGRGSDG